MTEIYALHRRYIHGLNGAPVLLGVSMVVAALSLLPLGFILYIALTSGWDLVSELVFRPKVAGLLANTLLLSP